MLGWLALAALLACGRAPVRAAVWVPKNRPTINRLKWEFLTRGWIKSSPAVSPDGSMVYVGSSDGSLYGVEASSGIQVSDAVGGDGTH